MVEPSARHGSKAATRVLAGRGTCMARIQTMGRQLCRAVQRVAASGANSPGPLGQSPLPPRPHLPASRPPGGRPAQPHPPPCCQTAPRTPGRSGAPCTARQRGREWAFGWRGRKAAGRVASGTVAQEAEQHRAERRAAGRRAWQPAPGAAEVRHSTLTHATTTTTQPYRKALRMRTSRSVPR